MPDVMFNFDTGRFDYTGLTSAEGDTFYIRLDGTSTPTAVIPFTEGLFIPTNKQASLGNTSGDPRVVIGYSSSTGSLTTLGGSRAAGTGVNLLFQGGSATVSGQNGGKVVLLGGSGSGAGISGWVNVGGGNNSPTGTLTVDDLFSEGSIIAYDFIGSDREIDDGNSGTADTIDWGAGNVHKSTLTGNVTYTFTAPKGVGLVFLKVIQGSGPYTITWPASAKFHDNVDPTISTVNASVNVFTFLYDGTNYNCLGVATNLS